MKKILYFLRYLKYYFKQKNSYKISFLKCIKAFCNGFTPNEYYLFNFDKNEMGDYLSEYKRLHFRNKLNGEDYTILLDNKVIFRILTEKIFPLASLICKKDNNKLYDSENREIEFESIFNGLSGDYIIKPFATGGGEGIKKISVKDGMYFINHEKVSELELKNEFDKRSSYILERYVVQAKYSSEIFSKTSNTIRLVTLKKENNEIVLVKAVHRFGTNLSIPTDNLSRYGIACEIDLKTGILQKCKSKKSNEMFEKHPDTDEQITGKQIPNWSNIVENVIKDHSKLDFLTFISWDILLTDEGYSIIEANASCGVNLLQLEKGIRYNKDIYELYKRIGAFK